MFDNCKTCRYKRHMELMVAFDDEDRNGARIHYCTMFMDDDARYVILNDVWSGKVICPHYRNE